MPRRGRTGRGRKRDRQKSRITGEHSSDSFLSGSLLGSQTSQTLAMWPQRLSRILKKSFLFSDVKTDILDSQLFDSPQNVRLSGAVSPATGPLSQPRHSSGSSVADPNSRDSSEGSKKRCYKEACSKSQSHHSFQSLLLARPWTSYLLVNSIFLLINRFTNTL